MRGLGPESMALIEEARDGDEPTLADQERIQSAIAARLASGAAAGLAVGAVAKSSVSLSGGHGALGTYGLTWLTSKALIGLVALGAIGASVAMFEVSQRSSLGTRKAAYPALVATEAPALSVEPPTGGATSVPVPATPPDPGTISGATDRSVPASPAFVGGVRGGLRSAPPADPTGSAKRATTSVGDVAAEVLLLEQAHAAMRSGQAVRALGLLEDHARRYPNGALGEERDATRISALCSLGRVAEARDVADRFLRVSPLSPHAGRVRASCGGSQSAPVSSF
jgi:hypothetical protein